MEASVSILGRSLGHYRIVRDLGAGGMGQVFVAEDTRLKREVALKILPAGMADNPDRRERFQREAEAVAALSHPNIVTIHSIETATPDLPPGAQPVTFITMQLVEGRTLADVIPPGGLPLPRFLELALPLADALSAAHRKGIIHRDLKPGNVMVGADGRVWVLDFGLAKVHPNGDGASWPDELTEPTALTHDGAILGTAPYMSPELASGLSVDNRSDIFSLGIVFHEMLSGRRPFLGNTTAELVSAILRDTPDSVSDLRRELPPRVGRIVRRCLEKRPDDRYQAARDLHADLADLKLDSDADGPRPGRPSPETRGPASAPRSKALPLPAKPSLAVLPFVNLSDDPEQDYFAAGLAADINADLVKISGLFLISQTTTQLYAKKPIDPRQVGAELGVRHVLVGTVRRAANQVRITAQLVDTQTGEPLWADRFDGKLDDLFALQDEITEQIVTALDVELVYGEASRISRQSIRNPRARDIFYRALPRAFGQTREDLREGRRLLREAEQIEPASPMFSALMAWAHYFEVRLGVSESPEKSIEEAVALADRAIELNDPSGMAWMLKGAIHLTHREHEKAFEASEKALADRPSCPWAFALKGNICNYTGRPGEAIELARQAIRLTPLFPPLYPAVLAIGHYLCRQPDEAIDAARGAIELAPANLENHVVLTGALAAAGHPEEAAAEVGEIRRIKGDFSLEQFAESQPFKNPADLDQILADLRAAGLG
jgi:serine/threonine protein kinase/tetratricopeptide (TPR) repeat protein